MLSSGKWRLVVLDVAELVAPRNMLDMSPSVHLCVFLEIHFESLPLCSLRVGQRTIFASPAGHGKQEFLGNFHGWNHVGTRKKVWIMRLMNVIPAFKLGLLAVSKAVPERLEAFVLTWLMVLFPSICHLFVNISSIGIYLHKHLLSYFSISSLGVLWVYNKVV